MVTEYESHTINEDNSYLMCWILGASAPVWLTLFVILIVYLSNL